MSNNLSNRDKAILDHDCFSNEVSCNHENISAQVLINRDFKTNANGEAHAVSSFYDGQIQSITCLDCGENLSNENIKFFEE